jgi:hypothetical protein
MKKPTRKLVVRQEVIRSLDKMELARAAAGEGVVRLFDSGINCPVLVATSPHG